MFMMASCSKNQPQAPDPDAWVSDLSLPVPIQFGGTSLLETKGYETPADLNGAQLGVVGLSRTWTGASDDVLLEPQKGSIAAGIVSLDGGTKYYPRESDKNYSFYGYCCPNSDQAALAADGSVTVPISGMGKSMDILWAKAEAGGNGYNAKYIREQRTNGGNDYPTFSFNHVTACLEFKAFANSDGNHNLDSDFTNIKVKRVSLIDVSTTGTFCVAGPGEGTIVDLGNPQKQNHSVDVSPTLAGATLGTFYAYPDPDKNESFEVEVVFDSPNGRERLSFFTGKLEPGVKYLYKLKFNKVDDIKITVAGVSWKNEVESECEVDDMMNSATGASEDDETQDEPVTPEP